MRQFTPTDEQAKIADAVAHRYQQHLAVDAAAGTGKSTTAKYLIANIIPPNQSVLYCAFNKHNAVEFMASLRDEWGVDRRNVEAKTFNSLGFQILRNHYREDQGETIDLKDDKYERLINLWYNAAFEGQARSGEESEDIVDMASKLLTMLMVNTTFSQSGSRDLVVFAGVDRNGVPIYLPNDPRDHEVLKAICYRYRFGLSRKSDYYFNDTRAVLDAIPTLLRLGYKMMDEFWSYEMCQAYLRGDNRLIEVLPKNRKRTITFTEQLYWAVEQHWAVRYTPFWIIVDECLPYRTPILLADGTSKTIGEIVDNKLAVEVLAYDTTTGQQRPCKVTNWSKTLNQKPLVKIKVKETKKRNGMYPTNFVVCTIDHKVWANGEWIAAGDIKAGMRTQVETSAAKSDAYKITSAGRQTLSTTMTEKNKTLDRSRSNLSRIVQRGGNGHGVTLAQQTLHAALGDEWLLEHAVPTKQPRGSGYPTNYKIDLANPQRRIAVEVDGTSHQTPVRKEQDAKKTALLTKLGWRVLRFTNRDAIQNTDSCVRTINTACAGADCPVEAVVVSVAPTAINENYVYDLTVEGCHNFYANGILVHNCQDISPLDRALIDSYVYQKDGKIIGRVLMIGDPQQAIYHFRGADSKGFPNSRMFWRMNDDPLTLSLTRRCPKVIVAAVQGHKPGFRATDDAPEGAILDITVDKMIEQIQPGDAVISRLRAPMMAIWRKLLAAKKPAIILGRDVSGQVIGILKKVSKHKGFEFSKLYDYLHPYQERKVAHMIKAGRDETEIALFFDKMAAVYGTIEGIEATNLEDLIRQIEIIFKPTDDETPNVIKLMTGHGSKGLEFPVVWNITPDAFPFSHPLQTEEQIEQEDNLWYVMMTRTKNINYRVQITGKKDKDKAGGGATATAGESGRASELLTDKAQAQMLITAKDTAAEIGIDPDAGRRLSLEDTLADILVEEMVRHPDADEFDEDPLDVIARDSNRLLQDYLARSKHGYMDDDEEFADEFDSH